MPQAAVRVRTTRSALLVVFFVLLCVSPLALAVPWLAWLFVIPLVLAAWVLRAGVDVDGTGVTIRALFGSRRVPWDDVAGLSVTRRGQVMLVRANGRQVRMPVVRARHLPLLAAASGGRFAAPAPMPAPDQ